MRGQRPKIILEELRQTGHPLDRTEFSTGFSSGGLDRTEALRGGRGGDRRRVGGIRPSSGPGLMRANLHRHLRSPVRISSGTVLRRESCVCCRGGDDAQELENSTGDFRRGAACVS